MSKTVKFSQAVDLAGIRHLIFSRLVLKGEPWTCVFFYYPENELDFSITTEKDLATELCLFKKNSTIKKFERVVNLTASNLFYVLSMYSITAKNGGDRNDVVGMALGTMLGTVLYDTTIINLFIILGDLAYCVFKKIDKATFDKMVADGVGVKEFPY